MVFFSRATGCRRSDSREAMDERFGRFGGRPRLGLPTGLYA